MLLLITLSAQIVTYENMPLSFKTLLHFFTCIFLKHSICNVNLNNKENQSEVILSSSVPMNPR